MHRFVRRTLLLLAAILAIPGCVRAQDITRSGLEMFAVNVGKGDAIIIRAGDYACLIDAGKAHARGKITAAMESMGISGFDAVFLTHTDDDHGEGLEWLSDSNIPVGQWYASAMYTGVKEKKHPCVKAAENRNASVTWLRRGDSIPLGNSGAVFHVLAPASLNTDKDDNNSLVMMLESIDGRILLSGDMELVQEAQLMETGVDLSCNVLKVPNHADDDTTSSAFAKAASAQLAVISTSSEEKPGTPNNAVLERLRTAGSQCIVTQDAGMGIYISLTAGNAAWKYVDVPEKSGSISVREVVPGDDIIVLYNKSDVSVDLSGWYLFSDKGEEMFTLPEGCTIPAGQRLIIGTESSEDEDVDLIWPDKKVINKSKTDIITLYDRFGNPVDSLSNGY